MYYPLIDTDDSDIWGDRQEQLYFGTKEKYNYKQ